MDRSMREAQLTLTVAVDGQQTCARGYRLHPWANRRLLLPLPDGVPGGSGAVAITVAESDQATQLVLDNLRCFES
jgi:hypothetical protein